MQHRMHLRRTTRCTLACAAALLVTAGTAGAATYTAAPGGVGAALAKAQPGDVVQLGAGSFRETATVPSYSSDVTLTGAPGTTRTIRGLVLRGGRHLRITGLRFQYLSVVGTDDLTVDDNDFTLSGAWFDFTDRMTIRANKVHDSDDGIVVDDATEFSIEDNECWNVPRATREQGGDCVQMARTRNWVITRNWFHDQPAKPHVDAIEITDDNYDGVISRNRFARVRGIVFTPGDATPYRSQYRMTVVNNLFVARSFAMSLVRMVDSRVVHNTLAGPGGIVRWGGASSGNAMVGNIVTSLLFSNVSYARSILPLEDYNLIASHSAGYRRGPNSLIGTATYVNPSAMDYRLAPGSKGIGYGWLDWLPAEDLTGAARTAPDLGAYAFKPQA